MYDLPQMLEELSHAQVETTDTWTRPRTYTLVLLRGNSITNVTVVFTWILNYELPSTFPRGFPEYILIAVCGLQPASQSVQEIYCPRVTNS